MKKTLITVLASVLLVAVGIVVGMSLNRPTDVPDPSVGSPEASVDTLSSETQNADNTSEASQSQAQEIIDTSNAQDLPHDKLWQYFTWTYHDLGYALGYDELAKPEMLEEQYRALETRFPDFFDIAEYKLPDNYQSEYDKYLEEEHPTLDITVDSANENTDNSSHEQETDKTVVQKPAEQKPAETSNSGRRTELSEDLLKRIRKTRYSWDRPSESELEGWTEEDYAELTAEYLKEMREIYPELSEEGILSLFGNPIRSGCSNNPAAESGLFGG